MKVTKILGKSRTNFWYYVKKIEAQAKNGFFITKNVYFLSAIESNASDFFN